MPNTHLTRDKTQVTTAIESSSKSWVILIVYVGLTVVLARFGWQRVRSILQRSAGYQFQTTDLVILLVAVLVLVLVARILLSVRNFINSLRLDRSAELSRATVVDKWVKRDSEDEDYWLMYEYAQGHRAQIRLTYRRYQAINVGDEILVEYLPKDVSVTRIKQDDLRY